MLKRNEVPTTSYIEKICNHNETNFTYEKDGHILNQNERVPQVEYKEA